MRVVFAGTPQFAVPSLRGAMNQAEVVGVYTQPDRVAGRGRALQASPVKQFALEEGLPVFQPESLRTAEARRQLAALKPDVLIVVAYGQILGPKLLAVPVHGCWNVHASLLPRWRGAAPIQRAIEAGDAETGVCLMRMQAGLDTGPVMLKQTTPIGANETAGELHDRLSQMGAQVLRDGLALLRMGLLPSVEYQDDAMATYAHKLDKSEARLDFNQPAAVLARKVRAFNPWPMAEAIVAGERIRILIAEAIPHTAKDAKPGDILSVQPGGLDIACGEDALRIRILQREGGRAITAADWANARRNAAAR